MKVKIRSLEDLINKHGVITDAYGDKSLKGVEPRFLVKEMANICGKSHSIEIGDIRSTTVYLTIRDKDTYHLWDIPTYVLEPVDRALVEAHIENLKRGADESKD